jgi:hypothetical protein
MESGDCGVMRRYLWLFVALALSTNLIAAEAKKAAPAAKPAPGLEMAQTISMITGVAISPLLGVGAVGAWKYVQTPEAQRAQLPWFAQPWFWVPALLLVLAVFVKDAAGTVLPTSLKKPLDVMEAAENKISGLVATGAFVPLVISVFHDAPGTQASLGAMGFAAIDLSSFYNALLVPVAMFAFILVWLASHAINMLILISPFSTVDAALKSFRLALLATVPVTSYMNPYLGAAWALVLILISYFLAGWAFRLTTYGSLFIWDYLTFARTRFAPDKKENWMFLARETGKAPIRSFGKLSRNDKEELVFRYRPWLVLSARELVLPPGRYAVGRGLVFGELVRIEGEEKTAVMLFPPRYNTHEEKLASVYGLGEVVDVGIIAGLKSIGRSLRELFGMKPATA